MPSIRRRIKLLEHQVCGGFARYVVISSWEYDTVSGADALAQYVAANGPVADGKQVVLIGWSA